jgi:hypothetical protein
MPGIRNLVRVLVGAALWAALAACAALPVPESLPAVALGQVPLYRLEVALAAFYGCLLLATPAYSGLVLGRLPIEISTRGAKFASEADQTVERDEATIRKLEGDIAELEAGLSDAEVEIKLLKRTSGDKT